MKNYRGIFYADVDGTTLNLSKRWYGLYNADYDDNLDDARVTGWSVHSFVKPECGKKIYDYLLLPDLYDDVEPIDGAIEGIQVLKEMDFRVVFLSSGIHRGKYLRLKHFGLLNGEEDYICAHDKSLVHGDYLLDDGMHNIKAFHSANKKGYAIVFDAPHNRNERWLLRADGWVNAIRLINTLEVHKL